MNINKLAEEKYPVREIPPLLTGHYNELRAQKIAMENNSKSKLRIEGFISGYQTCEEKAQKLFEALKEAKADFETLRLLCQGSKTKMDILNAMDSEIKQALSDWEGENKNYGS